MRPPETSTMSMGLKTSQIAAQAKTLRFKSPHQSMSAVGVSAYFHFFART